MIRSIMYNIKQGLIQLVRNRGMSIASIFAILAMMLVLGVFFVITVNVNLFIETVRTDYDQVEVYISDDATSDEVEAAIIDLYQHDGVKTINFRSKAAALEIMKERWGESGYLLDSLGENPLPASLIIDVYSIEDASEVADYAGSFDCIEDVQYYKETIEKLTKITDYLKVGAIIIMSFLIVVSIVIVSNTVKLTVFAREKEIFIMKYVGANNWFIRGPFLAEGIIIGVLGAFVSTAVVSALYKRLILAIGENVIAIVGTPLIDLHYMTINLFIIFVVLGIAIGTWGSIISMRRFLDT